MNIEDVKIGTKVRVISTKVTDEYLGYNSKEMLSIGSVSQVVDFDDGYDGCDNVELSDGYWYAVDDLELLKAPEKDIARLTVSLSTEDKEEIAKDILKIVLQDLNVIIADAIVSLSNDSLSNDTLSDGKDDELTGFDTSDEKLQHLLDEATKDVMKEIIREQITSLNKQAFNI